METKELKMQAKMELVRAKVAECIALAEKTYGIKMPAVNIQFDLTGRCAGMAGWKWNAQHKQVFYVRFNVEFMALGGSTWDHLLNETVPHEIAHTVCQAFPKFGRNHDAGWKKMCASLGGNGKRCYTAEDMPEAIVKNRPFTYTTSMGIKIPVSAKIHRNVQNNGRSYSFKGGRGRIDRNSPVAKTTLSVVETKPVVKKTVKTVKAPKLVKTVVKEAGKVTNASKMRAYISTGATYTECVKYGQEVLGQVRPLAISYVKAHWVKAGRTDAMV